MSTSSEKPSVAATPPPGEALLERVRRPLFWLGPLALTAIYFHRALAFDGLFVDRDAVRVLLPLRSLWANAIADGHVPEWAPFDALGQSAAGLLVGSMLHPINLLFLVLPLGFASTLAIVACTPAAMWGMHLFARQLGAPPQGAAIAAVAFAFSGDMIGLTNNASYLMAAATLPWAAWASARAVEQRTAGRLLAAGASLALVLMAGDAEAFALACALAVVFALGHLDVRFRSRLFSAGAIVATAALLAAPQLLPSLVLMGVASPGARNAANAMAFSFHPLRLLEPLLGPIFAVASAGDTVPGPVIARVMPNGSDALWVDSAFVGVPALVLGVCALWHWRAHRRAWAFVALWVLVLCLALGVHAPLYGALYDWFPPWRLFRYPEKLLPFLTLGAAAAAAVGAKALLVEARARLFTRVAVAAALGCFALWAAETLAQGWTRGLILPRWPEFPPAALTELSQHFSACCLVATGAALACAAAVGLPRARAWAPAALLTLQFLTSLWANERTYLLGPRTLLTEKPPLAQAAVVQPFAQAPARVLSVAHSFTVPNGPSEGRRVRFHTGLVHSLAPETGALFGLENAEGYLPGGTRRVHLLKAQGDAWLTGTARLFSIDYLVFDLARWNRLDKADLTEVARDEPFGLVLARPGWVLPRLSLAAPRCVADATEALALLPQVLEQQGRIAAVECSGTAVAGGQLEATAEGTVMVRAHTSGRWDAAVTLTAPAVLVATDAFAPGWSATVDGAEVPVLAANVAVNAVALGAGAHRVQLVYRTPGLRPGLALAITTALVLAALALRRQPAAT